MFFVFLSPFLTFLLVMLLVVLVVFCSVFFQVFLVVLLPLFIILIKFVFVFLSVFHVPFISCSSCYNFIDAVGGLNMVSFSCFKFFLATTWVIFNPVYFTVINSILIKKA